jgi:hypothetical protein
MHFAVELFFFCLSTIVIVAFWRIFDMVWRQRHDPSCRIDVRITGVRSPLFRAILDQSIHECYPGRRGEL